MLRTTDITDLLSGLVEKSLIIADTSGAEVRYRLLESVRHYGREHLAASADGVDVRARHSAHFLALAEEAEPKLTGADQGAWLARLEAEHDNLRAALEWCTEAAGVRSHHALRLAAALLRFWDARGHLSEGRAWLASALATDTGEAPAGTRAKALSSLGTLAREQGDYAAAREHFDASLAIRRELGERRGIASSLNNLGTVAYDSGDCAAARAYYEEALQIYRELGVRLGIAVSLNNLGLIAIEQRDYAVARGYIDESLRIEHELGNRLGFAGSLHSLGELAAEQGDCASACEHLEEALKIARELDADGPTLSILEAFARLALRASEPHKAACLWGATAARREAIGIPAPLREQARRARDIALVRADLGEDGFDRAFAKGRTMSWAQASELALRHSGERKQP